MELHASKQNYAIKEKKFNQTRNSQILGD